MIISKSLMKDTGRNYRSPRINPAVICDFDDATALENVAELLLNEFGGDGWKLFREQNSRRAITLKEYQERAFRTIKVSKNEMKNLVKARATLRPKFKELFDYCHKNNIPLVIASMGLDFYVEALLEREGMESISHYTVDTEFTDDGIVFGYRYTWEGCWQPGNCKCRVLEEYKRKGHCILFAGDGNSDICPAQKSDVVFAHRFLEKHCKQENLPYIYLNDFSKIIDYLEALKTSEGDVRK